ncbi:MAG: DUF6088 family protein [Clostridia bacterium]|nr:DUF6088 family protein [Clostridia bacterium]
MFLISDIQKNYNLGEPILLKEIVDSFSNTKKEPSIRQELGRLVEKNELIKAGRGIYVLPEKSITGKYKKPDFDSIIQKKYFQANDKKSGYYAGLTALNNLGISFQVPNIKEITTNKESSRKREVVINNRNIILRRPRVNINNNNANTLQFLDIITIFEKYSDIDKFEALNKIISYYKNKNVTMDNINKYIKYYPAKTSKKIMEYKIYNEFTQI